MADWQARTGAARRNTGTRHAASGIAGGRAMRVLRLRLTDRERQAEALRLFVTDYWQRRLH
jgi:hypothetical protein